MSIQAQVNWIKDLQFVARSEDGPAVVMDSPESGSGASPMALLLMGTAGCTAVDVIAILEKKRMAVTDFQVNVFGTRAQEYPRRYTDIHFEYVVCGTGIQPRGVEQAIALSETKYCGAMASLNANFTHSYRIEEC